MKKFLSNEYFEDLMAIAAQYGGKNYDYYFLSHMFEKNRTQGVSTIIAGSSYAMEGISVDDFPGGEREVINFGNQSQDLYYSFCCIKKAVLEAGRTIQNCIISLGYYTFWQDLSLSKREGIRVRKVYEPLLGELHHMEKSEKPWDFFQGMDFDEERYPREMLSGFCDHWTRGVVAESGGNITGGLMHRSADFVWKDLSEEEKQKRAGARAASHNKMLRYHETRMENEKILNDLVSFLREHSIVPVFVVFPFTKEYLQWLDPVFRTDMIRCLESIPFPVEFFDMNEVEGFGPEDFVDSDHLNDEGAKKATSLLSQILNLY